jgi:hypothetical protein
MRTPTTPIAQSAARFFTRWFVTGPSFTSPWARWSTIRASGQTDTSSWARRRPGSRSPTAYRSTKSIQPSGQNPTLGELRGSQMVGECAYSRILGKDPSGHQSRHSSGFPCGLKQTIALLDNIMTFQMVVHDFCVDWPGGSCDRRAAPASPIESPFWLPGSQGCQT